MGTDLGPATVKVTLNVAEAKRQIEDLRREIRLSVPVATQGQSPVQKAIIAKSNPRTTHPTISGDVGEDPYQGNDPYWNHDNIADGLRLLKMLKTTDRMRKFAPLHVQKAAEDASLVSQGSRFVMDKVGLGAEQAGTLGGVALTTAALAAAVHATAQIAPIGIRALTSAGLNLPPDVKKFADDFQSLVANLEHRISNLGKAPKEAFDIWAGGARITGQLPDFLYYWNQAYDIGVAEDDLNAKFEHFKRNEVADAVGRSMGAMYSKSFDR